MPWDDPLVTEGVSGNSSAAGEWAGVLSTAPVSERPRFGVRGSAAGFRCGPCGKQTGWGSSWTLLVALAQFTVLAFPTSPAPSPSPAPPICPDARNHGHVRLCSEAPVPGWGCSPVPISPRPFFQAAVKGRRLWAQKTQAGAVHSSAVWHQANGRTSLRLSLLTSTVEMAVVMPVERHRGARRADRGTARVFSPRRLRRAARPDPFTQVRVEVVRA